MKNNKITQIVFILLFFNNLIGIIANLLLAIISVLFAIGIPGVCILLIHGYWLLKKDNISNYKLAIYSILFGFYNWFIYSMTLEVHLLNSNAIFMEFYPALFTRINIVLYAFLFISSIMWMYKSRNKTNIKQLFKIHL